MGDAGDLRTIVRFSIGLLCAVAGVLILMILSGSEFDDTSGKAIGTAAALAFLSLTAAAGSNLLLRQPRLSLLAYGTVLVSAVAFLVTLLAIWASAGDGTSAADALIVAFACGHSSVLLAARDGSEEKTVGLVRVGTLIALWLLVAIAIAETGDSGADVDPRALGVVAVLYALGSIVLPLLRRAGGGTAPQPWMGAPRPGAGTQPQLDHLVIAVTDRARSDHFYTQVLGATVETDESGKIAYRVGAQRLNVHEPGQARAPLAADPVRPGNSDLCFAWPGDVAAAAAHLHACGVPILEGPVARTGAHGEGLSVYCRDPDGRLIELISYR